MVRLLCWGTLVAATQDTIHESIQAMLSAYDELEAGGEDDADMPLGLWSRQQVIAQKRRVFSSTAAKPLLLLAAGVGRVEDADAAGVLQVARRGCSCNAAVLVHTALRWPMRACALGHVPGP